MYKQDKNNIPPTFDLGGINIRNLIKENKVWQPSVCPIIFITATQYLYIKI